IIEEHEDGSKTFEIYVVINQELQREFFGFVDTIKVLSPQSLVDFMGWKFRLAKERYETEHK
ncbi:MAG: WYL domain-containing protein, partial [Tannerellaceae bacterium]|nr:WYL domain-containing protein [Tannerellaceae bacterium]